MKNIFITFLFLLVCITNPLLAKVKVVATLPILEYITKEIGNPFVEVKSLIPGNMDPHYADARPDYILKLNQADLLVYIGLDLEIGWLPKLIEQARNPKIYIGKWGNCDTSKNVHILEKPEGKVSRFLGDIHIYGNPHYWLDPINVVIVARNIKNHLVHIDPSHKKEYQKNFKAFAYRIKNFTLKMIKQYQHLKGLKIAVYHKEFVYFSHRFGLKETISIEEKPGVPPSAIYLKKVMNIIMSEKIKVILIAPYNNPKYANFVAQKTNAKVIVIPTNLTKKIPTYEMLISTILKKINNVINYEIQ